MSNLLKTNGKVAVTCNTHFVSDKVECGFEEPWHVECHPAYDDRQEILGQPPLDGVTIVHSLLVVQRIVNGHVSKRKKNKH